MAFATSRICALNPRPSKLLAARNEKIGPKKEGAVAAAPSMRCAQPLPTASRSRHDRTAGDNRYGGRGRVGDGHGPWARRPEVEEYLRGSASQRARRRA